MQSDYFQYDGNTCLPRFRADEVAYISRYYSEGTETTTAADIVVDTDRIILYCDGVEYFRYEMTEEEFKEMRRQIWELDDDTDSTTWMLNYCRAFATSKMNNTPETPNPDNIPTTMNANETTANDTRTKSINGIMDQANRLMSVCNAAKNFKRADAIRAIAFRYYDNIRACVGRFNYDDDGEYNKEYSRAQYMNI